MTYTIRCNEHVLSDGRLTGYTWEDQAEAQEAADHQTEAHREADMDCVFQVIDADEPLILSEEDFVRGIFSGMFSPYQLVRAISPLSWELDDIGEGILP